MSLHITTSVVESQELMEVEWLMIADAAEVLGNKLYVIGGGWNRLSVPSFPVTKQLGIALAFNCPWSETNEKHQFEIEIATDDAQTLKKASGQLEVGRAPGIVQGSDQRVQIAANVTIEFKEPGNYLVISRLDGEDKRRVVFQVVGGAANLAPPPAPASP